VEGTPVSLGVCRLGGGIINSDCLANNGNTYQPMEYLNGTYPITDDDGVHYNCDVRAHGGYGVPRADCCRCNAADALSATRERMFKVTNAAYHCYYGCRVCTHASPSTPPPPPNSPPSPTSPPPLYDAACYLTPNADSTWTGEALQGISSDLGFSEAGHLCLQVPECHAVVESDFENGNLLPQKRYVLHGPGALQAEAGRRTLVRDRNQCTPSPPPPPPTSPPAPPSHPFLRMQTRPLYLVSFQATVQTTVEAFNVPAYASRMSTALGTPEVGVTVAPGSVIVTTTAGADDQSGADQLVSELTDMSSDPDVLSELYGAPAEVDLDSVSVSQNPDATMPPPPPPSKSKEDHTLLAILIILAIVVPTVAFLLYLQFAQSPALPKARSKPYTSVTTSDLPPRPVSKVSFKFDM